jgi:anti-sigma regulatory factor (Ser/Thr protein kinase)
MVEQGDGIEERLVIALPPDRTAPRLARQALAHWGANVETDVAVSELVTNAIEHGEPPITLTAVRTPEIIHVEVSDARHDMGAPRQRSAGLRIVEAFSTAWGVVYRPNDGKVLWVEFVA